MLNVRLILIGGLLVSGCATTRVAPDGSVARVGTGTLPAPNRSDVSADARPFYIGPLDELAIDVVGVDDIPAREVQVDASGRLSFPYVGSIEVAGKTPDEVSSLIEAGLRAKYIRDPHVTINLKKTVSQNVTVEGEVKEPGIYPIIGRMSLLRAVASAKGTTEFSKLKDVVVLRTVQGKSYAALYNLEALRQGAYADPELFPNDVVVVGDSRARHMFKDFLSIIPLLTTPIILLLQN